VAVRPTKICQNSDVGGTYFQVDVVSGLTTSGETETIRASEPNNACNSVADNSRSAVQQRLARNRRRALRFAAMAVALCGTVVLAGWVIAGIAGFGLPGIKNTDGVAAEARSVDAKPTAPAGATFNADAVTAVVAGTRSGETEASVEAALPDTSQTLVIETLPVRIADPVHTDAKESANSAETLDESLPDPSQMLRPETLPLQIAAASAFDLVHSEAKEAVSSTAALEETLSDPSQAFGPETPPGAQKAAIPTETLDKCPVRELCIDQYLWSVYQRTPKQDTIKVVERKKVTVKINGKPRTVIKEFTKLVDEDFTWKDPKAAEKVRMSLMEYVVGGIDQGFKLKLYYALHAMDDAGLSPGITSAFRDDYRQSIASGLKAATDRSYHGGSFRGGYGHGLAADLVSVKGETRAERLTSSENLWKWIDAHGQEWGIGRPYLDRDPAHVAPIDGKEYADRRRGRTTQVARTKNNLLAVSDDHSIAKRARTARSSKVGTVASVARTPVRIAGH
jgi:hypothetical protein